VYISLVEHPARMECGVEVAAAEFPPSYRRASVMQATLAAMGLVSSIAAWLAGATFWWVTAGALLGSVIPFTLIVILPTNSKNYDFTLVADGRADERCPYTLEVEPKVATKFLYRGRIWVDAEDFTVCRIEAEPAKNPSFWIQRTDISHVYLKVREFLASQGE